ncbi:MAG TPA: efflux RND transporter periplasmic adaptor subunit [Vicinamibacteria bacterium]|nr:efflux RND transporter periplasmic adaptor subunit [Vicinamibacteria bacterium]
MTTKTKRVLGVIAAVAIVGSIVGFNVSRESRQRITVQTGKVGRHDLTQIVTASGEVRPKRYVNVGANVSGRLIEINVKEGDWVEKGQVLARVESERYQAVQRQSEAGVSAGQADLDRAQADLEISRLAYERNKQMRDQKLVSDQQFDQAEADYKMKKANVEASRRRVAQLQAAMDSTKDDLVKTTVIAPMSGAVTNLPMEPGEMVIGAMSFSPTVIMTVADLSVMECEVMVDETDFRNLKIGQDAEIKVDALEGLKLKGEVTEIGSSALVRGTGTSATQTSTLGANTGNQPKDFKVKITIKNPPSNLKPGLNATADITTATRQKVIAVPVQAVVVREVDKQGKVVDPEGGAGEPGREGNTVQAAVREKGKETDGVFTVQGEKVVFKPVKTGIMGETDIEVVDGLAEGQEIVTGSYKTLRTLKDQAKIKADKPKGKAS